MKNINECRLLAVVIGALRVKVTSVRKRIPVTHNKISVRVMDVLLFNETLQYAFRSYTILRIEQKEAYVAT